MMEDDCVYNNSIWDECETCVREVLKINIRGNEQDEDFSGYDRGGWLFVRAERVVIKRYRAAQQVSSRRRGHGLERRTRTLQCALYDTT